MWNTVGGDENFNLYISQTGNAGSFINSGNSTPTSISVPLSPGTYNFSMFGEGGSSSVNYFGLNLFLDGNSTAPSISVFAPFQTSATAPAFHADAQSTPFLGPYNGGTLTLENGAGTTSVVDGPDVITLTSYAWANQSVYGLDRVNGYGSTPNGVEDFVGEFSLVVTAVPEPTSFLLLAVAIALHACVRRRRAV